MDILRMESAASQEQIWNAAVLCLAAYKAEPAMFLSSDPRLLGHTIESLAQSHDVGDGLVFLMARDYTGHLYLAVRGSCKWEDWTGVNLQATAALDLQGRSGKVHSGFMKQAGLVPVEELLLDLCHRRHRVILCGHSMGGAVAALAATRLLGMVADYRRDVLCVTFGAPMFADEGFAEQVRQRGEEQTFLHCVARQDIVPVALRLGGGLLRRAAAGPASLGLHRVLRALTTSCAQEQSQLLLALDDRAATRRPADSEPAAEEQAAAGADSEPAAERVRVTVQWLGTRVAEALVPEYVACGRVVVVNPAAGADVLTLGSLHMTGTWARDVRFPECVQEHAMDFYLAELRTSLNRASTTSGHARFQVQQVVLLQPDLFQPVIDHDHSRCGQVQTNTSGTIVLRFALEGARLGNVLPLTPRHLGLPEAWHVRTVHRSYEQVVCEAEAPRDAVLPGRLHIALGSRIGSVEGFHLLVASSWYMERKDRLRDGSFSVVVADLLTLITTKQRIFDATAQAGRAAQPFLRDTKTAAAATGKVIQSLDLLHALFCDPAVLPEEYRRAIIAIGAADKRDALPTDAWRTFAEGLRDARVLLKIGRYAAKNAQVGLTDEDLSMPLPKLSDLIEATQRDNSALFEAFRVLRLYDLALLAVIQAGPLSRHVRDNNWWWWVDLTRAVCIMYALGFGDLVFFLIPAGILSICGAGYSAAVRALDSIGAVDAPATAISAGAICIGASIIAERGLVASFDCGSEGQATHYMARTERVLSWLQSSNADVCRDWQARTVRDSPFYDLADHYKLLIAQFLTRLLQPIHQLRQAADLESTGIFCVMAVGQPTAGKTSLLNALFGTERILRTSTLLTYLVAENVLVMDFPGVGDNAMFRDSLLQEQRLYVRGCDAALVLFKCDTEDFDVRSVLKMVRSEERPLLVCLTHSDQWFRKRLSECREALLREGICDEDDACFPAMIAERALSELHAMLTTFCERFGLREDQVKIVAPRDAEYAEYPEALRSSGMVSRWEAVEGWLRPLAAGSGVTEADFARHAAAARDNAREARRRQVVAAREAYLRQAAVACASSGAP